MRNKPSQTDIFLGIVKESVHDLGEKKIQVFDDGWDYIVIVVNNTIAFRFPRREDYAKTLPAEVKFLESFSQLSPVETPKLSYKQDKKARIQYVTYSFIPGVQFTQRISATFSKSEKLNIAKKLGLFLTAIHSFPIEKAEQLGIRHHKPLESWKKRLIKIKNDVFPQISVIEQSWTLDIFGEFIKIIGEKPIFPVLIHSDIGPEHIIVNPENHFLSGIIDFGDIEIADPAYDFTFLDLYERDFLNEVYRSYGLPRDSLFEKRKKFYRESKFVINLEHSLKLKDRERIKVHKNQLSEYVNSQHRRRKK